MGQSKTRSRRRVKKSCPTPNKHPYHNGIQAMRALQEILNKRNPVYMESRMYKCACGKFHLTSREL